MNRCLVTGAAGFIGSHLCEALLAAGHPTVGVDCFTDYYDPGRKRANLERARGLGLRFVEADLATCPLEALATDADVVFHLAGQPGVRTSWDGGFKLYAMRNVVATQRLLEACAQGGVRRLVFASSSSVYGGARDAALDESAPRRPISPYGLTKAACEDLIDVYRRGSGLSAVSLRYFTVYGPRQRPEMAFAQFIDRIAAGAPITVYGDGRQTRDFTYVGDAVAATIAAADRGKRPAYNVSGGATATLIDAIREIERAVGRKAHVAFAEAARGDARHTRADLTAAATDLGYQPIMSLAEGVARQVAHTLGHEQGRWAA
ncbi:MAG TPA: NAD-dependent epimerase/dehydratase family protein [Gaiellales bacterium]|nr:NAD-dependent epimerase/dehydratase family protein [Gaiellales bacterium]